MPEKTMKPFPLDLVTATKLESLREAFESQLSDSLNNELGLGPMQLKLILQRSPEGRYVHAAIDGAWKGFQWGGDHVRRLVRSTLDRLDAVQDRDATRPNAAAVLTSHDSTRKNEPIDWSLPLYDSDGYEHALVVLGGVQVVTKLAFAYVVWDRRTRQLAHDPGLPGEPPLSLSNSPMTDDERSRRQERALAALRQIDLPDEEPTGEAPRG